MLLLVLFLPIAIVNLYPFRHAFYYNLFSLLVQLSIGLMNYFKASRSIVLDFLLILAEIHKIYLPQNGWSVLQIVQKNIY